VVSPWWFFIAELEDPRRKPVRAALRSISLFAMTALLGLACIQIVLTLLAFSAVY
jgi:hypothetical protein